MNPATRSDIHPALTASAVEGSYAGPLLSTPTILNPSPVQVQATAMSRRPTVNGSLRASGARLREKTPAEKAAGSRGRKASTDWHDDAWAMYDQVGEQRFLANTIASRLSQARFFVGRRPTDPTEEVEVLEPGEAAYDLGQGFVTDPGLAALLERYGQNQFIVGDCYVCWIPADVDKPGDHTQSAEASRVEAGVEEAGITPGLPVDSGADPLDGRWVTLSAAEVQVDAQTDAVTLILPTGPVKVLPSQVVLIRVWKQHPRDAMQSDSPVRSSLPVLRELVGLTQHAGAQIDSRLSSAGILLVPSEADRALRQEAGVNDDEPSPLTEELVEIAATSMEDRSSASAMVPLVVTVPDQYIEHIRHISWASPLDKEARGLRQDAIERIALSEDCPPELLTGMGGMNHWGAWLIREDVVSTHLEPHLARLCGALTSEYLWPALVADGMDAREARKYVLWYDIEHLVARPNRATEARNAFIDGALSGEAYLDALGFDASDAPVTVQTDAAVEKALAMATAAPSLAQVPGLPTLVRDIRALYAGEESSGTGTQSEAESPAEPQQDPSGGDGGVPDTDQNDAEAPTEGNNA